jgi:uncharacterized iron-regulated membrane protein
MKQFRKLLFWCHLCVGATAGIIILLMSITGVLLTYERQVTLWADTRTYHVIQPSDGATGLPVEELIAKVRQTRSALPASITIRSDSNLPTSLTYTGGSILYVDPYTGAVFGEGAQGVRSFFRTVTDWHRWLGAKGENRTVARAITGACNLGFLFIVVSGLYLWMPRTWTRRQVRNVAWFKRGLSGRGRDFNWHNVIGLWSFLPLFVIVLSGVVISYPWASNLVYRVVGETSPVQQQRPASGQQLQSGATQDEELVAGLSRLFSRAEAQVQGWSSITMQMPQSKQGPVSFTIDTGNGGEPHKRAQLALSRENGEVVRWEPFSSYSTGRRLRSILRFAHTGEVAGVIGQTAAGLASLGGAFLVWTGLSLALRRLRGWMRTRSTDERAGIPPTGEELAEG